MHGYWLKWRYGSISDRPKGRPRPRPLKFPENLPARETPRRRVRRPFFHGAIIAIALATAVYAAFLPSRSATRANSVVEPVSESASVQVPAAQPVQETLAAVSIDAPVLQEQAAVAVFESAGLADNRSVDLQLSALVVTSSLANELEVVEDTPEDTASVSLPSEQCEATESLLYCVYTVQRGDTLSSIASKFGLQGNEDVAPWELLVNSNWPDIGSEDDLLQIDQQLRIPLENGVIHTVISAQTLSEIAGRYDVPADSILAVAGNGIGDVDLLNVGQELLIPNPKQFSAPLPVATSLTVASGGSGTINQDQTVQSEFGFMWPTTGPISSYYGPGHPLGIDIDLHANPNGPIAAASGGTVTFAGGNACCSYGFYIIIDHGNGLQTLYAHLSSIYVVVGQVVGQGEVLGASGSTGYSTGNHLHFEVHVNGAYVDPVAYLP